MISDNSGFIFDAVNAEKRVILLRWDEMDDLLTKNRSYSTIESPEQQIAAMEKDLMLFSAKGGSAPPGFHAHLGMLYSVVGKSDQMVAQFEDDTVFELRR